MDPSNFDQPSKFSNLKSHILELIEFVAITAAIVIVIHFFIAEPHEVSGNSMLPNFQTYDYVLTNKIGSRFSNPNRGEVVILKNPRDTDVVLIKRVVGLPNETIKIERGNLYINNQMLSESYLDKNMTTPAGNFLTEGVPYLIPDNSYIVLGDNRTASSDSRNFGPVKKDHIIGQAILRYWPLNKIGIIPINKPS